MIILQVYISNVSLHTKLRLQITVMIICGEVICLKDAVKLFCLLGA